MLIPYHSEWDAEMDEAGGIGRSVKPAIQTLIGDLLLLRDKLGFGVQAEVELD